MRDWARRRACARDRVPEFGSASSFLLTDKSDLVDEVTCTILGGMGNDACEMFELLKRLPLVGDEGSKVGRL